MHRSSKAENDSSLYPFSSLCFSSSFPPSPSLFLSPAPYPSLSSSSLSYLLNCYYSMLYCCMVSYSHLSVYCFAMQSLMMSLTSFAVCILSSISICCCSQYAFDPKKNRRGVIIKFMKVSIKLLLSIIKKSKRGDHLVHEGRGSWRAAGADSNQDCARLSDQCMQGARLWVSRLWVPWSWKCRSLHQTDGCLTASAHLLLHVWAAVTVPLWLQASCKASTGQDRTATWNTVLT